MKKKSIDTICSVSLLFFFLSFTPSAGVHIIRNEQQVQVVTALAGIHTQGD